MDSLSAELSDVHRASRVSMLAIADSLRHLKNGMKVVQEELPHFARSSDAHMKLETFFRASNSEFESLERMKREMTTAFEFLLEWLGENKEEASSEDLFSSFRQFCSVFARSAREVQNQQSSIQSLTTQISTKSHPPAQHSVTSRKGDGECSGVNDKAMGEKGEMDNLLESLRKGDIPRLPRQDSVEWNADQDWQSNIDFSGHHLSLDVYGERAEEILSRLNLV